MLVPEHFAPSDPDRAWKVIAKHGFGTIACPGDDGFLVASPLPFLARPSEGKLIGHIARANPHLALLARRPASPALVIFQGPSGFISGGFYADEHAIPTWDHVTVHVHGMPRVLAPKYTLDVLEETVAHFEARAGSSWRLDRRRSDLPAMAAQVAAFEISVSRIEATLKLSQNIPSEERKRVVTALRSRGDHVLADAIQAANAPQPGAQAAR